MLWFLLVASGGGREDLEEVLEECFKGGEVLGGAELAKLILHVSPDPKGFELPQ